MKGEISRFFAPKPEKRARERVNEREAGAPGDSEAVSPDARPPFFFRTGGHRRSR